MKIRSDYLEALYRQEQASKSASAGSTGFEDLLSEEIGRSGGTPGSEAMPPPGAGMGINALLADPSVLGTAEADQVTVDDALVQSVTGQASGLLQSWEMYSGALSGGGTRDAWNILAGMDQNLRSMRNDLGSMQRPDSALESMVNELEVLSATEKFKFNRGDYF